VRPESHTDLTAHSHRQRLRQLLTGADCCGCPFHRLLASCHLIISQAPSILHQHSQTSQLSPLKCFPLLATLLLFELFEDYHFQPCTSPLTSGLRLIRAMRLNSRVLSFVFRFGLQHALETSVRPCTSQILMLGLPRVDYSTTSLQYNISID
jgi:hypothetical protein